MIARQLRRMVLTGVGLTILAREGTARLVDDMLRRQAFTCRERQERWRELAYRAQAEGEELQRRVREEIRRAIERSGLASREELAELRARIARLEERLDRPGEGSS